jgi:hypothetical protein
MSELELSAEESECVLALRGLLGFGVLEHCLQLRVNVNFGINRCAALLPAADVAWPEALCMLTHRATLLMHCIRSPC